MRHEEQRLRSGDRADPAVGILARCVLRVQHERPWLAVRGLSMGLDLEPGQRRVADVGVNVLIRLDGPVVERRGERRHIAIGIGERELRIVLDSRDIKVAIRIDLAVDVVPEERAALDVIIVSRDLTRSGDRDDDVLVGDKLVEIGFGRLVLTVAVHLGVAVLPHKRLDGGTRVRPGGLVVLENRRGGTGRCVVRRRGCGIGGRRRLVSRGGS